LAHHWPLIIYPCKLLVLRVSGFWGSDGLFVLHWYSPWYNTALLGPSDGSGCGTSDARAASQAIGPCRRSDVLVGAHLMPTRCVPAGGRCGDLRMRFSGWACEYPDVRVERQPFILPGTFIYCAFLRGQWEEILFFPFLRIQPRSVTKKL